MPPKADLKDEVAGGAAVAATVDAATMIDASRSDGAKPEAETTQPDQTAAAGGDVAGEAAAPATDPVGDAAAKLDPMPEMKPEVATPAPRGLTPDEIEKLFGLAAAAPVMAVPPPSVEARLSTLVTEPIPVIPAFLIAIGAPCLIVTGPAQGRWRARRQFAAEPVLIALNDLNAAEIAELEGDSELRVERGHMKLSDAQPAV